MLDHNLAEWVKKTILTKQGVAGSSLNTDNTIVIQRDSFQPIHVAAISSSHVSADTICAIQREHNVNFIVNIKKDGIFEGSIYNTLFGRCGIGGMGDLLRCLREEDPTRYLNPEASFILRGLHQHSNVEQILRVAGNIYEARLNTRKTVRILSINDYDITVESVREALRQAQDFHVILKSNPNGRITEEAVVAANASKKPILKWRQLLGYLAQ